MKISILTDNIAGGRFKAEHGLSYLIEIDGEKILFDTGHSNVFLDNAAQMGINLQEDVKTVVLSHGHWDHGNGLKLLSGKKLLAHPAIFSKRFRKKDHTYIGLNYEQAELENLFRIETSKTPVQIAQNLWFLGEIPRLNDFEAKTTSFESGDGEEDFIPDDSALVAITKSGLIVVSGCAHSGICNICEYAKKVTGISTIHTVIGGFHLKDQGEQTQKTLHYFLDHSIQQILPSHCTELPAKALFYHAFTFPEVKTGMSFQF